ncbi:MAG: hypothetical protein Q9211_006105 [Gyalolechia sp. 1 TL-2023]
MFSIKKGKSREAPASYGTSSTQQTSQFASLKDHPFSDADKRTIIALVYKNHTKQNQNGNRISLEEMAESLQYTHQIEKTDRATMEITFNDKPPRRVTAQDLLRWINTAQNLNVAQTLDAPQSYDGDRPYWWVVFWWYRKPKNLLPNNTLPNGMEEWEFDMGRTDFWFLMGNWRKNNQSMISVEILPDSMPDHPMQN